MIAPDSPIVTAARDTQAAALARGATLEEAIAEGLEAAIASFREQSGPIRFAGTAMAIARHWPLSPVSAEDRP